MGVTARAGIDDVPVNDEGFRLGFRPALDGLRCFAVLMVMLFHSRLKGTHGGFFGVDVFFVISGFLITSLLLEERAATGRVSLKRFYMRRALRLVPAMVVVVLVVGICTMIVNDDRIFELGQMAATVTYSMNWLLAWNVVEPGHLSHSWSLAIEEQFYIVWPITLLLLLRFVRRPGRILALLGAGIIGSTLLQAALWRPGDTGFYRAYFGLDTRAAPLLVGCAVAVIAAAGHLPSSRWSRRFVHLGAWAGVLMLIVLMQGRSNRVEAHYRNGIFLLVALAVGVLITDLLRSERTLFSRVLEHRAAVWVGRRSYGLYLWHIPIFALLLGEKLHVKPQLVVLASALSFAAAAVSYRFVEQPFLRLKHRYSAIPTDAPAASDTLATPAVTVDLRAAPATA